MTAHNFDLSSPAAQSIKELVFRLKSLLNPTFGSPAAHFSYRILFHSTFSGVDVANF